MRFAFPLLLSGLAARFLALGARQVPPVLRFAFVFGSAGLLERNCDCLLAAFHLAALSAGTAFQLAVGEFMHDAAGRLPLTR
jgi:hypothetical protein